MEELKANKIKFYKGQNVCGIQRSDDKWVAAIIREIVEDSKDRFEVIVELPAGIKCHAYWDTTIGTFDIDNVFGMTADSEKIYQVTYEENGVYQSNMVRANSESEAKAKKQAKQDVAPVNKASEPENTEADDASNNN